MSKPPIEDTRRHLGELHAMASDVDAKERGILEQAERGLTAIENDMDRLAVAARTGGDEAAAAYQHAVTERGRLHQVIAQARANLPD